MVTGEKGWKIVDRHFTIKRLLSSEKIYFSKNLTVTKNINGEDIVIKNMVTYMMNYINVLITKKRILETKVLAEINWLLLMHLNVLCHFLNLI
ncbi:hypothetical protein SKUN_00780 [Spiroplasma kunkelii CR2-3x]|uniref:Uncharacterized protein n=1 Tax=Spiroplasma kunkelii CR2-3x TaxID=273035 RepID=A0A0K2JGE8_SPIKU|nr:hypothetical protein SKUN_00780 [Spiroplasma kunkelii CR2-3x]